ncbi:MAG: CinA family protein [Treponema sp.]|nr:CinA family protein [Treponema sp.]
MLECEIELINQAEEKAACLIDKLKKLSKTLAIAESCTSGLISSVIGSVPGASDVFWGSFICYTKDAKIKMLDLNKSSLETNGLVSKETACSMADGVLAESNADFAAAVTGLAGPSGDGSSNPVGTVWAASASRTGETETFKFQFSGGRNEIRIKAAIAVLDMILKKI